MLQRRCKVDLRGFRVYGVSDLSARGFEILTCGTCLNFYGITEKLQIGSVTNMYDIVERMSSADRVIKP